MSQYPLTITKAGLQACINAKAKGIKLELRWMSVGDQAYTPSENQTALRNERQRTEFGRFTDNKSGQVQTVAVFRGEQEYAIRELGLWLSNGVLLGVASAPRETISYKAANGKALFPATLDLSVLPKDSVEILVSDENLNILFDKEMMMDAVAFMQTQLVATQQSYRQLVLSEKVRQMEGKI